MIVLTVLVVVAGLFSRMVVATADLRGVNRENAVAAEAARSKLEEIRNTPFRDIFLLYNPDPADDPGGVGTGPGNLFAVRELKLLPGSVTGFQLEVILPALPPEAESQLAGTRWDYDETIVMGGIGGAGLGAGGGGGALGGGGGGGGGPVGGGGGPGLGAGEPPEPPNPFWELREDYVDEELGMPRDLNGDSIIDAEDHKEDYILLPMVIRVEWAGRHGPRTYEIHTMLADFIRS